MRGSRACDLRAEVSRRYCVYTATGPLRASFATINLCPRQILEIPSPKYQNLQPPILNIPPIAHFSMWGILNIRGKGLLGARSKTLRMLRMVYRAIYYGKLG